MMQIDSITERMLATSVHWRTMWYDRRRKRREKAVRPASCPEGLYGNLTADGLSQVKERVH